MLRNVIALSCLLFLTGCSSAIDKIAIGGKSNLASAYLCPMHTWYSDNYPDRSGKDDLLKLSSAEPDALAAIDTAKFYIEKHSGREFISKVYLCMVSATYRDSTEAFNRRYNHVTFDEKNCGDTKYCVTFAFTPYEDATYYFDILQNERFEIISDLALPYKDDGKFFAIISPQQAAKLALKKKRRLLKNAGIVSLEYDDNLGSFVWEINGARRMLVSRNKYEYWSVTVNATDGRIVGEKLKNGYYHARYF